MRLYVNLYIMQRVMEVINGRIPFLENEKDLRVRIYVTQAFDGHNIIGW